MGWIFDDASAVPWSSFYCHMLLMPMMPTAGTHSWHTDRLQKCGGSRWGILPQLHMRDNTGKNGRGSRMLLPEVAGGGCTTLDNIIDSGGFHMLCLMLHIVYILYSLCSSVYSFLVWYKPGWLTMLHLIKSTHDESDWQVTSQKPHKKHKWPNKHHHHGGGSANPSGGVDSMNPRQPRDGEDPVEWF